MKNLILGAIWVGGRLLLGTCLGWEGIAGSVAEETKGSQSPDATGKAATAKESIPSQVGKPTPSQRADSRQPVQSQWGGSSNRNNLLQEGPLPIEWQIGHIDPSTGAWNPEGSKNIRWVARLGSQTYGAPVVAGGKVFCGTNNGAGYLRRYPPSVDLGCLLAFDAHSGRFLWQLSREKLSTGQAHDWPEVGICSTPLVEGDRLWIVTNRAEVLCLDTEGFLDGENDGPYRQESVTAEHEADIVWLFDMMGQLGSRQHNMASCSATAAGDLLFVCTGNGVDESHQHIPAPEAPSFLALDKRSGKVVWADNSPGKNILHGQWGSPAVGILGGVAQVIFPGGDGWLYSFLATAEQQKGRPKLLWRFDCNPKPTRWRSDGRGDRNELIATPVLWENRVYIATGQDPQFGEGPGILWCIDPRGRGDTSPELVVDRQGNPVPPTRLQAADPTAGHLLKPNPNSALVWKYTGQDLNGDGHLQFEETFHRTIAMPVIANGLLVIGDFAGLVHCLDAQSGKLLWTHDMLASVWASPLVADGKIYIADEDGDVLVFALSREKKILAENQMLQAVYATPTALDGFLYIATRTHLVAIGFPPEQRKAPEPQSPIHLPKATLPTSKFSNSLIPAEKSPKLDVSHFP
ncbi:MAG: PQQ-binding-like beta-propeller repeat protein [Thermoguttaceae bacterium]|nr:PQQ-binding-like beta-propeller repeat protein [Thermoguttaceae bacterium]MDW8038020.1 PQQ-binding-like beta-propeller repeat protein [Thermoguttaceae bacterium]